MRDDIAPAAFRLLNSGLEVRTHESRPHSAGQGVKIPGVDMRKKLAREMQAVGASRMQIKAATGLSLRTLYLMFGKKESMRKNYEAEKGVLMDANFVSHCSNCAQCRMFDAERPASISVMCLEGSVLWKRENAVAAKREPVRKSDNYASKDELKRIMRYKE
jgi:hypothetical protein